MSGIITTPIIDTQALSFLKSQATRNNTTATLDLATYTIPAGKAKQGQYYHGFAMGTFENVTTSHNMAILAKLDSTELGYVTSQSIAHSSNTPFWVEWMLSILSAASATSIVRLSMFGHFGNVINSAEYHNDSVDLSIDRILKVSTNWNGASASTILYVSGASIILENARGV
jgi:hypothetical protein